MRRNLKTAVKNRMDAIMGQDKMLWTLLLSVVLLFALYNYFYPRSIEFFDCQRQVEQKPKYPGRVA